MVICCGRQYKCQPGTIRRDMFVHVWLNQYQNNPPRKLKSDCLHRMSLGKELVENSEGASHNMRVLLGVGIPGGAYSNQ